MSIPPVVPADLLPLRMLNEYAYCPRLYHFMYVEGRWADNEFTIEGRHAHRRMDALDHLLPEAPPPGRTQTHRPCRRRPATIRQWWRGRCRSRRMRLGLTAKLDLVATEGTWQPRSKPSAAACRRTPNGPGSPNASNSWLRACSFASTAITATTVCSTSPARARVCGSSFTPELESAHARVAGTRQDSS